MRKPAVRRTVTIRKGDCGFSKRTPRSVVGRDGVVEVLQPELTPEEQSGLQRSAQSLKNALKSVMISTTSH